MFTFRELKLFRIFDRVVTKALQLALDPYWRSQLPGLGRGVWDIYAKIQRTMRERQCYHLAEFDIQDCFPSTPIEPVLECHRRHISQPDLLWLIETIIRGHRGLDAATELYQGSPYSPVALELLLHHRLDAPFDAEFRGFPQLLRYVDNLQTVCSGAREGHQVQQFISSTLAGLGMCLKSEGSIQDLRDDPGRVILGLILGWKDGHMTFSIPDVAYDDLSESLAKVATRSKALVRARATVIGWISAVGPVLTNRLTPEVVDRVCSIARDCGFTELRPRDLLPEAHSARNRWYELSEG